MSDFKGLRPFLQLLEKQGELIRVKKEVKAKHELSAVLKILIDQDGPAVLFEKVQGYNMPVVGNVFAARRRLLLSINTTQERIFEEWGKRTSVPVSPKIVKSGPVKDIVLTGSSADIKRLPVPIHNLEDGGPYITAGVTAFRKPNGLTNMGLYRVYAGRDKVMIRSAPGGHLWFTVRKAEEERRSVQAAIIIGADPEVQLAAGASLPYDADDMAVAGSLKEEPVEVVKCETVDAYVPANAEIVIEGEIVPSQQEKDGPFGDFAGYYQTASDPSVSIFKVTAITHRKDAIFQTLLPAYAEHFTIGTVPLEARWFKSLREVVPTVKAVYRPPSSLGFLAIVSIKKTNEMQPRLAILSMLTSQRCKHVIIVDDDVNIFDLKDVQFAISTRFQGDKDLITISNLQGSALDPSSDPARAGSTAKVGIDATKPLDKPYPKRIEWPKEVLDKAEAFLPANYRKKS